MSKNQQTKQRDDIITFGERRGECIVDESLPSTLFKVRHVKTGAIILCPLCGNMRRFRIKVLPGDSVKLEVSPTDLTRGRITRRY